MNWEEMAAVGQIARAHGLRGQVIVNADTDYPDERFRPGATLYVLRGGAVKPLTLTTVRFHRDRPVVGLEGVGTIDDAEALAGLELRIPVGELAPLPAGTFYRHDLIGCHVQTSGGDPVGIVENVEGTMAGSRLVVAAPRGEILIPLVSEICTSIDTAGRRIVVDPPPGLLELNTGG